MILLRFALAVAVSFAYSSLFAQASLPIPVNKHFFEISPEDSIHHRFNKIVSYTADSIKIERTFTLENKLIRIERRHPQDMEYQEYSIEKYTEAGDLIEKTTVNQANTKYISTYFHNNEQVGQVIHRGESKYRVFRNGYPEPKESLYNDFMPHPIESKKVFSSDISSRVNFYPSESPIYSQQIWIAVFVEKTGEITAIEWANPLGCEERFVERFIKAIEKWKYGFTPALDHLGNPKSEWWYIHFHFGSLKPNG